MNQISEPKIIPNGKPQVSGEPLKTADSTLPKQNQSARQKRWKSSIIAIACIGVWLFTHGSMYGFLRDVNVSPSEAGNTSFLYATCRTIFFYIWMYFLFAPSYDWYKPWVRIIFSIGFGALFKVSEPIAFWLLLPEQFDVKTSAVQYNVLVSLSAGALLGLVVALPSVISSLLKKRKLN